MRSESGGGEVVRAWGVPPVAGAPGVGWQVISVDV